jgi:hypothetical protein
MAARALAIALIIAGAARRVALGGHWTSGQMITSIVLVFLAAIAATAMLRHVGDRGLAKFR